MNLNDLITQADAARLRGVSRASVNELVRKGRFRRVQIGGKTFLLKSEVLSYVPETGGRPMKSEKKKNAK
jgi:Helix-turn-helix domain